MMYYLLLLIGMMIGYMICALMVANQDEPAPQKRCSDCAHSSPIPEGAYCIFRDNEPNCHALGGVYYATYLDGVSVVKEDSFCDEFLPDVGKEVSK